MSGPEKRWPSSMDMAFGPGATWWEQGLAVAGGIALATWVAWSGWNGKLGWSVWQLALAILIALDLGAGSVANVLEPCRRYYHNGPLTTDPWLVCLLKRPFLFCMLHIYPILIGLIFGNGDWTYGMAAYALLGVSCAVVLKSPGSLQRPVAFLLVLFTLLSPAILPAPQGFDWLMPVLFLKLVAGHCVRT